MANLFGRFLASLSSLLLMSGLAFAQTKVAIAVGGAGCLC
jgi:hypothetical protein